MKRPTETSGDWEAYSKFLEEHIRIFIWGEDQPEEYTHEMQRLEELVVDRERERIVIEHQRDKALANVEYKDNLLDACAAVQGELQDQVSAYDEDRKSEKARVERVMSRANKILDQRDTALDRVEKLERECRLLVNAHRSACSGEADEHIENIGGMVFDG